MTAIGWPSSPRCSAWRLETTITVAVLAGVAQLADPPSRRRERALTASLDSGNTVANSSWVTWLTASARLKP